MIHWDFWHQPTHRSSFMAKTSEKLKKIESFQKKKLLLLVFFYRLSNTKRHKNKILALLTVRSWFVHELNFEVKVDHS